MSGTNHNSIDYPVRWIASIVLCGLPYCCVAAQAQTVVPGVPRAPNQSADSVDVIVRFKESPHQLGHYRFLDRGALHKRSLSLVGAHVYTVNSRDLALLAGDPEVEYIGPDHEIRATATLPSTPDYGWMTVLGVTSPTATLPWDGTGIGVAVIDSGLRAAHRICRMPRVRIEWFTSRA